MFFFIFFDISSLLLRYITPAIPRSSRLDLSKNILKNIDSYLNFRTLGSRDSASHEQVLNHQNIRKPPGKSYSNPNPHPHPNSNPYGASHDFVGYAGLCALHVGCGRQRLLCLPHDHLERGLVSVKDLGSNAITAAKAGAPNEESENERRERG